MDTDRHFGNVTVLVGDKNGKYPHGNSILVRGSHATAILDPSMSVVDRAGELRDGADLVVQSHVHEDHVAGVHLFPRAEVHAHEHDAPGLRSLAGLMEIYGYNDLAHEMETFVSSFHYAPRPDTQGFQDGTVFDLGGSTIRAIHLPGHTRGHCVLLIEPEGVLFLGDIDLTGFGPYYGDAWSNLDDFERSLQRVGDIEARVWVSFHHVGVIEERALFADKLARFAGKIVEREARMLELLSEPRSVAEMVAHRFLYPPHVTLSFVDAVEERTIRQHLERFVARGIVEHDGGRYQRCTTERDRLSR